MMFTAVTVLHNRMHYSAECMNRSMYSWSKHGLYAQLQSEELVCYSRQTMVLLKVTTFICIDEANLR